ncbi:MAG: aldose 1-epimerase [Nocardioidaceae bacterium]|nr:aldose 1-epimerase [Nocardioidaceae bacterium]
MTRVAPSVHHAPSGDQHVIASDGWRAHITQVGATLRSLSAHGEEVISGFDVDERATDGRGQVLAPWPNRLTDGRYSYGGHDCQAPLNEPSRHGAIHGLVRWSDWSPEDQGPTSVTMSTAVRPQPGYEWHLELQLTYSLASDGLTVTFSALNIGSETAPFGVGFHPYLTVRSRPIEELELTLPATRYLSASPAGEPMTVPATATWADFTTARAIGRTELDTAFSGLVRDADGRAVARLAEPGDGRAVQLWVDEGYRHLMVYTADRVLRDDRRRTAVALEPMTCPPDALRSGQDLIELGPGATWQGSWGITVQAEVPGAPGSSR